MIILNIQGMDPSINSRSHWKIPYLAELLEEQQSFTPLIAITETWLKEHVTDAQINLTNYQILRADRKNRSRGGTLLYIHNDLPTTNSKQFDDDVCQSIVCNIDSINTIVASVYRPPNTPDDSFSKVINFLQSHINTQSENKHKNILVLGDFNLPHLTWSDISQTQNVSSNNSECTKTLTAFMDKNFLSQYIENPTRQNNILDLVLSNDVNLVKQVEVKDTELSDHRIITIKSSFGLKQNSTPKIVFEPHTFRNLNFYKTDFAKLNKHLKSVEWNDLKLLCDPQDYPELVRLVILQVCEFYAPAKCFRTKSNRMSAYRRERKTMNRKNRKLRKILEDKDLNFDSRQKIKRKIVETHKIKNSIKNDLFVSW